MKDEREGSQMFTKYLPIVFLFWSSVAPASTIYTNNFETAVGSEWSKTDRDMTPIGSRWFLGQFASEEISLTLQGCSRSFIAND
jgi:hypothetical protein